MPISFLIICRIILNLCISTFLTLTDCLTLYTYSHDPIRHIIPRGEGYPIIIPHCLFLDGSNTIFISDKEGHLVSVFSFEGVFIYSFGRGRDSRKDFIKPRGIAMDARGRILVLTENSDNCVQLF